jgi:alpha-L-fucosidase
MTDGSPTLVISNATFTSKWFEGSDFVQIIEMTVKNTDTQNFLNLADALDVTVSSSDLNLIKSGTLIRLAPGQAALVQVGVQNKAGVARGSTCSATITAKWGAKYGTAQTTSSTISGKCGFGDYTADTSSIAWHASPEWYNDAKFGIFIHWGVYSAPAYGSVAPNESYAEW